ncbi:hypothetical protein [Stutzerimonas urumqiensis]|uniref:hypothetical protein n=1 Tax=Stutzerimonas urumqiensis TaxID=638269 RepID=UPI003DA43BE6
MMRMAGVSADEQAAQGDETGLARASFAGYLTAVVAGLLAAMAAFVLVLLGLRATGNLPPPAFSNSLCVDEKLNFLRNNPIVDPTLLVVGSSVAWRHVDGDALVAAAPGTRPMNGAFCGLHVDQTAYVTEWLLDRQPTVRQVVMVVDPLDFAGCWRERDAVFDRDDVDRYVYQDASPWLYYLRYFAPISLTRNALKVSDQRAGLIEWDPLVFNRHGDGPLVSDNDRGLFYGTPEPLDGACFAALADMADTLDREGRQLTVVSTPLHPEWKALVDPDGSFIADYDARILQALGGTTARYWNADQQWQPPETAFIDAIHLRWSAAQAFSAALARQLGLGEPTEAVSGGAVLTSEAGPATPIR